MISCPEKEKNQGLCGFRVIFDFDNTITEFDVLDDLIERFSVNKSWLQHEKDWKDGKIGSKECLRKQLLGVRITRQNMLRYISGIKIDPYFKKILSLLEKINNPPVILSDSFDFMIRNILSGNGIKGVKIYSNRIGFNKDRILPQFPYESKVCLKCAHCKKEHFINNGFNKREKKIIYVGDGLSDFCAAENADIIFAKAQLLKHLKKIKIKKYRSFKSLKTVYNYLKGMGQG